MDKQQHGKADVPETPGSGAAPASAEPLASQELPRTPSPGITPEDADDSAAWDAAACDETARPARSTKSFENQRSLMPAAAGPREDYMAFEAAAARESTRGRWRRMALPAVSLMVAVGCGAAAGAAGVMSFGWLAPSTQGASAPEIANLPATIEEMRSDIAALKTSVDAAGRSNSAQFAKLGERFDRMERSQTVTVNKTDAAIAKEAPRETTGSITVPASGAALPVPAAPPQQPAIVPGWGVRDVYRGAALLQSRAGGMVEVEAGDVLPGLGRIDAIRRQDGRWVVITSRGMIPSMR
jgi:hypothetical protein